ncbi:sugar porter family MFS transporter [Streptantibioticus ferralitis]|uniref:Sugar porter family MFS transporter n=1 Tax=Streptantibioticus ferralitis TaxID=236510 RepID=A0ABT5ZBV8_9ACTN|nr:sugar porter family MFS transporter [Streptantibioticus ferralitis]MDF2261329.1 sugar porter family MFS transporter [Streptantibioticus ferralitis]
MSVHAAGDQYGDSQNVLEMLDQRSATSFYWSLTLLATIGGFLFGYDTANIGSALSFVPYHLSGFALGYLVAGASVGAAVGALLAGPLTDLFGRKSLLIADAAIYTVGALLSAVTWHAWVLITARTLIGLAIGADSAIATAYIAEYAPAQRRGALSMLQQWMITVGILISYIVALVILRSLPGHAYGIDWRLIFGLGALPALVGLVLRTRMPESPRWLLEKGRYVGVQKAMRQLGIEVTIEQVERTAAQLRAAEEARKGEARISDWTPGVRRALVVICVFFTFQQITGINVPLYYGPRLLAPLFQSGGHGVTVDSAIAGVEVTAIMTAVNVGATYFGFKYIDRIGRRGMAMGGYGGMAVSALVAAFGLGFLHGTAQILVVMIGLNLFIASFAVGVGGTGWLIQGETFPTAVRGRAAAIGAAADWLANFVLVVVFPTWQSGIGLAWVLVCFAGLAVVAIGFVYTFLPETKGLSVDEIIHLYEEQAAHTRSATGEAPR